MSEEQINPPQAEEIEQPQQAETTADQAKTISPGTSLNPLQVNLLQGILLAVCLVLLNVFVYRSVKSSAQAGDPGNPSSADGVANLAQAAKDNPNYDGLLALGVNYYNNHRYQEAIDAWKKALELRPNSELLYSNMGAAYGCLGQWQEEKECCEKALAINPNFALAHNNLNWALSELARQNGGNAGNTPNTPAPAPQQQAGYDVATFNNLLNQGLAAYNNKNFEQAIGYWQKALAVNPNSEVAYSNIGAAYGCLGKWREQVASCQKALEINPNYQLAANNLAWGKQELQKRGLKP